MRGFHQVSEREKKFENTNYTNQSRCMAPPDWLRTTMARIVPSLQLAKTEDHCYTLHLQLLHLTPYILHLTSYTLHVVREFFLHKAFFARHYSLPPRQPSVFARLARWQLNKFSKPITIFVIMKIWFHVIYNITSLPFYFQFVMWFFTVFPREMKASVRSLNKVCKLTGQCFFLLRFSTRFMYQYGVSGCKLQM